jgi:hypothetical protein
VIPPSTKKSTKKLTSHHYEYENEEYEYEEYEYEEYEYE